MMLNSYNYFKRLYKYRITDQSTFFLHSLRPSEIILLLLIWFYFCSAVLWVQVEDISANPLPPEPGIMANDSSDDSLTISSIEDLTLAIGLDPNDLQGENADWWVIAQTPEGVFSLEINDQSEIQWGSGISRFIAWPMFFFHPTELPPPPLTQGKNYIFFGLDDNADGHLNGTWYDCIEVTILENELIIKKSSTPYNDSPLFDEENRLRLVNGITDFTLDFYHEAISDQETQERNILFSPFSLGNALGMLWAGTGGETADQIAEALDITVSSDNFHSSLNRLNIDLLNSNGSSSSIPLEEPCQLYLENYCWSQTGYPILSSFLDTIATHYNAGVMTLDFFGDSDGSRQIINQWVADRTKGKIENLLSEEAITPDTRLVLTNTFYFKASWRFPFETELTQAKPFTRLDGSTIQPQMMVQTVNLNHFSDDRFDAVELPYASPPEGGFNKELSMLVIIPHKGEFDTIEDRLAPDFISSILSSLAPDWIHLTFPKFEFGFETKCKKAFQNLGIVDLFDPFSADFSKMVSPDSERPWIDQIYHKVTIAVNEYGTEASAATAAVSIQSIVPDISADKPFIFIIRENTSGAILFMGRVLDPLQ